MEQIGNNLINKIERGLNHYILDELEKRGDFSDEELKEFRESLMNDISDLYQKNPDGLVDKIKEKIRDRINKIGPIISEKVSTRERVNQAGILSYNFETIFGSRNI